MFKNISVIGAGTMGHGIANTFAMHGYKVSLYEEIPAVRNSVMAKIKSEVEFMVANDYVPASKVEETLANITVYSDLSKAVFEADYVIEAVFENIQIKQNLFKELDTLCPASTILSSNTSSLPLKEIGALLPEARKKKIMVCHLYNPAHLIPIAELSYFGNMSESDFKSVYDFYLSVEKQPVKILKDIPGLIANRMFQAMAREVLYLLEIGAASAEDLDIALKAGPAFRGATTGIIETADMGGLDIWCTVEDNLFKDLNASPKAGNLIRSKVGEGKLGIKTGEGFLKYADVSKFQEDFFRRLIVQLKASKNY